MDVKLAIEQAESWRTNPRTRPTPETTRAVVSVLVDRIKRLEEMLATTQRLAVGRQVILLRGNMDRGPETGAGFGRKVPAVLLDATSFPNQLLCRLLVDDPNAVGAPCRAGDEGLWSASQVVLA